ncbi:MAG: DUF4214 domain-containing protein [Bdellovibrionales bacterium]|nr:DUF4214 domain-containing protein [Bdellovibrionales bacterium]
MIQIRSEAIGPILPPPAATPVRIQFFSILTSEISKTLSNSDFVENLYRGLLGRESDKGGLDFHKGKLDRKTQSREDL